MTEKYIDWKKPLVSDSFGGGQVDVKYISCSDTLKPYPFIVSVNGVAYQLNEYGHDITGEFSFRNAEEFSFKAGAYLKLNAEGQWELDVARLYRWQTTASTGATLEFVFDTDTNQLKKVNIL